MYIIKDERGREEKYGSRSDLKVGLKRMTQDKYIDIDGEEFIRRGYSISREMDAREIDCLMDEEDDREVIEIISDVRYCVDNNVTDSHAKDEVMCQIDYLEERVHDCIHENREKDLQINRLNDVLARKTIYIDQLEGQVYETVS